MKKGGKFLVFFILLFFIVNNNSYSQDIEDVTHYIVNAGFDDDLTFNSDGTTKNIIDKTTSLSNRSWAYIAEDNSVYAWAKTFDEGNGNWNEVDERTHAINGYVGQIYGWTLTHKDFPACEWRYFGTLPYDLEEKAIPIADNGNTYQTVPSKPESVNKGNNIGALFLRAGWGGECTYKQTISLPCARYRLEYWTINVNSNSNSEATDLTNVTCRNEVFKDKIGTGLSSRVWTKHEFEFTPTSEFTLEFGYKAENVSSNISPYVFIDGIKLYKIGESNYEEILKTDIENAANKLYAMADDDIFIYTPSIHEEIYEVCDKAFESVTITEMEAELEILKVFTEKIEELIPILKITSSLITKAEEIIATDTPKSGYEEFIESYNDILSKLEEATTDNVATIKDMLDKAVNDYYNSDGTSGNVIDCSFLIKNPQFTVDAAKPVYDEYGTPTYPNISNYVAGTAPNDATSIGWYTGNITSGDQRLNFAQGRICWNLWDTSIGEHTISQDLTELPDGFYTVSADMITQPDWAHEAHVYAQTSESDVSSAYLLVGNWNNTNNGEWTTLTTDKIRVTDGNLTIGGRSIFPESSQRGWFCMTNVHLYFHGTEIEIEDIKFADETINLLVGESLRLEPKIQPENVTFKKFIWESSNPDIITIDERGYIFAARPGESTITATSIRNKEVYAKCTIIVEENSIGVKTLSINEIQSSNIDMYVDPSFNYGGWIELYNPTDKPVSLYGLYVSDDINDLKKHRLNVEAGVVPAKGYKNIWFDHHNVKHSQVNFKLDYDGGIIYLSDTKGDLITSQDYPLAVPRTSYAKTSTDGSTWGLTANPTPEKDNRSSTFEVGRMDPPMVDKDAQLFKSPFTVTVSIPSGATLRYTTDGSTPTLNNGQTSTTGIFDVSSTVTYRFRLFKEGTLPSAVVTRSYLYKDRDIVLPVISVVTDPINLYDDSLGIYVRGVNGRTGNGQRTPCNWNMDWDRPVNFEYLTTDGEMVINQEVDMAMCGGWSRAWTPHSFKLKAEKIYEGKNFYDYPVFKTKPYLKHKTFQIRNGGNDNGSRIKDAALQEIVRTSGIYVDGQAYQPAVHYINGNYVGLLNIREPNNKHFAYANYGYDSDEIDMFEISPDSGYCQMTGTEDSFIKWYELTFDASNPETYEQICSMVDIDEYINYMAVEMYLGTSDWIRNNVKGFRPKQEDGKFHFVLFDLDSAFETNSPFTLLESRQIFTFNEIYDTGEILTEEIKLVTIFLNLLENDVFRKKFIDTFCLVAGSVFEPKRCKDIINKLAERTYSTLQQEGQNPYNTGNNIITSLSNRQQIMIRALNNYWKFKLSDINEQKVKLSSNIQEARILLNDQIVPTNKFEGTLFGPVSISTTTPPGYKFLGWMSQNNTVDSEEIIFSKGSEWAYYDQGSLDNENWVSSSFSSISWNNGNAPLGYYTGDNNNIRGYNTILDYGSNASEKRPTYYFRKTFNLQTSPKENDIFKLDFTVDDGFIVYVNGQEAGRYIMPSGNVSYNTFASTHASGNPDSGSMTLSPSLFKRGENIIAVEVHNNSTSSSDIFFDASIVKQSFVSDEQIISIDKKFDLPDNGNYELTALFEKLSSEELVKTKTTPIKINEICASNKTYINDYFEKNDWIELYNTTDQSIDVAGMYISDNLNKPQKYQIPSDENINTKIDPLSYLIIWADKLTPINQLHTTFKLDADGGEVILTSERGEWCDTLIYPAHISDYSVGLYPDGGKDLYIMEKQTLAETNIVNSYSKLQEKSNISNSIVNNISHDNFRLSYHNELIDILCENGGRIKLYIYTTTGLCIKEYNMQLQPKSVSVNIATLPNGIYFIQAINENGNRRNLKISK